MKTLYLLRHAKSSWKGEGLDDFDRPLSKRGRAAAKVMGEYLARHRIIPAQVLCSPAKRARETLERLQNGIGPAVPVRFEKVIYMANAPVLLRRVRRLNDSLGSAMLVGHNPGLADLALMLSANGEDGPRRELATKFPTGSLAVIETDLERWADLEPGCGRLAAFARAKDVVENR